MQTRGSKHENGGISRTLGRLQSLILGPGLIGFPKGSGGSEAEVVLTCVVTVGGLKVGCRPRRVQGEMYHLGTQPVLDNQ